jgi:hypothetical protein
MLEFCMLAKHLNQCIIKIRRVLHRPFDLFTRDMITTDERRRNICQEI